MRSAREGGHERPRRVTERLREAAERHPWRLSERMRARERQPWRLTERLREVLERHPWQLGVGALAAGLAASPAGPAASIAPALAVAVGGAACRAGRAGAIAAALALAGGALGEARLESLDAPAKRIGAAGELDARAHTLGHPRPSPFGSSIELEVATGRHRAARLLARVPRWTRWPARLPVGAEVRVRGELRSFTRARKDFARQLRRRGLAGELLVEGVRATGRLRGGLAGAVDRMRRRSERAVAAGMPRAEAALARGMVLGQDEAIAEPVRDDFRASGLAHLLAVSGQNVMLLVALALPALVAAGLGIQARVVALLALIALYVPLAGAGPSLQRAGVMGAAGIAALAASRPSSRVYALVLAAVATLAFNPRSSGDPGWQLSFAAVVGILALAAPIGRSLRAGLEELAPAGRAREGRTSALGRRLLVALADGAAITVAATVATAPLLAHHFGAASLAALPANLLALPAVAPAMWLGMLKAAVGQVAALGPPFGGASEASAGLLGHLARVPVAYIAWLSERFAALPGAQLALPLRSPVALVVAYAGIAAAALLVRRACRSLAPSGMEAAGRWRRLPPARRLAWLAAVAAALALAAARVFAPPAPPSRLTVRFLDVGQGDATLIQEPGGGAVLFDGGPPEADVAGLLRRAGVRRLAVLVATHASRDHHGGLREVLERFPVDLLLDGGDGSPDPAFRDLLAEARRRGVRRVSAVAPMTLRAGALEVRVLSPSPRPPGRAPEDPNPRAVVAVVSAGGFDLLLSGDAESEALAPLALPDVDAIKVPHHGSSDPGLPEVLERLRPELAAIEVGENTYGHPHPATLTALRRARVRTYRTDRHGTITVTPGASGLAVETGP